MNDKNSRVSRRDALKAIGGAAVATSLAGCSALQGKSEFQKQLDTISETIAPYDNNLEKAMEDGYTQINGPGVPGMGWHITNPKYTQDALKNGMSVEKPLVLVYDDNGNLGGAEYTLPASQISQNPDLLADKSGDPTEKWTTHDSSTHPLAVPPYGEQNNPKEITTEQWMTQANWAELFPPDKSIEPGDEVSAKWGGHEERETRVVDFVATHPTLQSMHIWTEVDNPEGLFNPTNPEFAQSLNDIEGHTHE